MNNILRPPLPQSTHGLEQNFMGSIHQSSICLRFINSLLYTLYTFRFIQDHFYHNLNARTWAIFDTCCTLGKLSWLSKTVQSGQF